MTLLNSDHLPKSPPLNIIVGLIPLIPHSSLGSRDKLYIAVTIPKVGPQANSFSTVAKEGKNQVGCYLFF